MTDHTFLQSFKCIIIMFSQCEQTRLWNAKNRFSDLKRTSLQLGKALVQIFLITCKISRLIDLRYGTEKNFLYRDSDISDSRQKKFFVSSLLLNFEFFLQNFVKISQKYENFQKTKIFELRKFSSLGRISVPYRFISIFLRSK